MNFPPAPKSSQEIYDFPGRGEYIACAVIRNTSVRQLMAFRALRIALGEQSFREALAEGIDILAHSTGITNPAGWLYWFIKGEADHAQ